MAKVKLREIFLQRQNNALISTHWRVYANVTCSITEACVTQISHNGQIEGSLTSTQPTVRHALNNALIITSTALTVSFARYEPPTQLSNTYTYDLLHNSSLRQLRQLTQNQVVSN